MNVSRSITGIVCCLFGIIVLVLGLVVFEVFTILLGLGIIIVGIYIFFNDNEDKIEQIREVKK